jgi:hypothetical protein
MPEAPATKVHLSFAKLVATPTETAWSQAYNAGNLFVCLSLSISESDEEISLHALGKDLFNVLQSEFFTLQEKNVEHIKEAIRKSLESVPQNVTCCLTLAFFKESTLLVFISGSGKIVMKRGEKVGTLLTKHDNDGEILSASGYVQNSDTLILETGQFAEGITQETVTQALELELPNDIVEALSPQIHKQDDGAQTAIIIVFHGASPGLTMESPETEEEMFQEQPSPPPVSRQEPLPTVEEGTEPGEDDAQEPKVRKPLRLPKLPQMNFNFNFNHRRKLYFNIAIILALILVLSIFFTIKKYNDDKQKALFQSIYPTAQQYYSEGQGLATVNPSLSQDSYQKSENLLKEDENKFPKGSQERQQIDSLITKVENGLQGNTTGQITNANAVQAPNNSLLAVEQSRTDGLAFGQDNQNVYVITAKTITTVSKTDGTTKDIITNKSYWTSPVAIVPYQENIYVLDQQKGLLKFVASGGGYGKTNYFNSGAPDLSQATGMAIDGSVWIVAKDGTIMEYLKGKSQGLSLTGLTKPLSNPSKIVTDITMENIYVLDNGNSRIVQFDKNGKYQNAYSSNAIAHAKDFDVSEINKKALILSGGKVFAISF